MLSTTARDRSSRRSSTSTRAGRRSSSDQSGGSSTGNRDNGGSYVLLVDRERWADEVVLDVTRLVVAAADQRTLLALGTAAEIVEGLLSELRANDAEAGVGGLRSSVLESVPPDVDVAEHGASNLLVVGSSVLKRGNSLADSLSAHRPAGLGDPDLLAVGNGLDLVPGILEELCAIGDGVALGILEVRVGIHAEPVTGLDDSVVGRVGVGSPCIDVTDGDRLEASALDGITGLLDVVDEDVRVGTGVLVVLETSRRNAVKILTSDGNTSDKTIKLVTVLVGSVLQSSNFVGEAITRSPKTKEHAGLGLDSSRNSRDGLVRCTALDHGVQTSTGEATVGTIKTSSSFELVLEIGLALDTTICKGGTVVEALESSTGSTSGCSHGKKAVDRRHYEGCKVM